MKKILVIAAIALPFLIALGANLFVQKNTATYLYDDFEQLPKNKVGVVLGTIKVLKNGRINHYYKFRLKTAVELYNKGKIDYLVLSGDNNGKDYNEPKDMFEDLLIMGIPADKIYLDPAGFRTLDSMVRCKEIFGQQSFTVISQKFHNERAVFIAREKGIEAIAANARSKGMRRSMKVQVREWFARVKMLLDLHLLDKQPHLLGDKVNII